jgi:hypothetical protein
VLRFGSNFYRDFVVRFGALLKNSEKIGKTNKKSFKLFSDFHESSGISLDRIAPTFELKFVLFVYL